eukprot:1189880-Prorocentrum_minimum.AAC.1
MLLIPVLEENYPALNGKGDYPGSFVRRCGVPPSCRPSRSGPPVPLDLNPARSTAGWRVEISRRSRGRCRGRLPKGGPGGGGASVGLTSAPPSVAPIRGGRGHKCDAVSGNWTCGGGAFWEGG